MGWLWSDKLATSSAPPGISSSASPPTASASSAADAFTTPPLTSSTAAAATGRALPRTPDEQADAELQQLIAELQQTPLDTPSSSTSRARSAKAAAAAAAADRVPPPPADAPRDPLALLPTQMSCRAAFDQAYHCQLPGGQFTNVYRYGALRNCSELWSNFWFCMRTNRGGMGDEERAARVRQHYWERERRYREGPSTEDVWAVRREHEHEDAEPFRGDWRVVDEMLAERERVAERS